MTDGALPNKWLMLAVSMFGQVSASVLINGAAFLIPTLHLDRGLTLFQAGAIASAPLAGMMLMFVVWGGIIDRIGERISLVVGLTIATAAALTAAFVDSYVLLALTLFIGGMGGASVNTAGGRVVVGYFPVHRRGLAMGIRQTALPLGVGLAALTVPQIAESHGLRAALLVPAALCGLATMLAAALIKDPVRITRAEAHDLGQLDNPYRRDDRLWRIHVASMLLVVPQFTVWTYALVWLIDEKGWSTGAAGAMVAVIQVAGALGRIVVGHWSDHVGSRLRPMRQIAVGAAAAMLALGLLEGTELAVALLVIASVITVADNGVAFTSVAEIGGPYWSGRTMGTQNTGQYLASAIVPPLVGATVAGAGYAAAFSLVAVFPLLAIPLVPVRGEFLPTSRRDVTH